MEAARRRDGDRRGALLNGELFIVGTPIGNLEDITLRALRILKEVDVIACEDTRHSGHLLNHYGIRKRTLSCRAENERASAKGIINLLERGESVAYISDAGVPGISDPGALLVSLIRDAGFKVTPIPGISASTALISVAGLTTGHFHFEGFLPQRGEKRKKRLHHLFSMDIPFLIFESPYRIEKLLDAIAQEENNHKIFLGREITKKFEEFFAGDADHLLDLLKKKGKIKGEFTLLVMKKD